ncbi:hypothetical protein FOA52_001377 [Chlamydomonas sp. UWO 241]|nr:hypothetical protein FOA52_001377 [Chlamydomonas sp. UWO 241]
MDATSIMLAGRVGLAVLLNPTASTVLARGACMGAGIVYPAYASFCALENRHEWLPAGVDEQTWLMYWSVYGMYSLVEDCCGDALRSLPLYYHAKCAMLLWLALPQTRGASLLYSRFLRPTLSRFRPKIDVCVARAGEAAAYTYAMYKVPIDALIAAMGAGSCQAKEFVAWLFDGKGSSTSGRGTGRNTIIS